MTLKTDPNNYLIPATQAKRCKGLYYIRREKEYTGLHHGNRELMYTLELCREKRKEVLISWFWHRSILRDCWIVKPECKLQDVWQKAELENTFVHVKESEELVKMIEKALELS